MIPLLKPVDGESPYDLLMACHEQIRRCLRMLLILSENPHLEPDLVEVTARNIIVYMTKAFPLHMEDEQSTVLPRLLLHAPHLETKIESIMDEHNGQDEEVRKVLYFCDDLVEAPAKLPKVHDEMHRSTRRLVVMMESHLQHEEHDIFPSLRQLEEHIQDEMVLEMRARRAAEEGS